MVLQWLHNDLHLKSCDQQILQVGQAFQQLTVKWLDRRVGDKHFASKNLKVWMSQQLCISLNSSPLSKNQRSLSEERWRTKRRSPGAFNSSIQDYHDLHDLPRHFSDVLNMNLCPPGDLASYFVSLPLCCCSLLWCVTAAVVLPSSVLSFGVGMVGWPLCRSGPVWWHLETAQHLPGLYLSDVFTVFLQINYTDFSYSKYMVLCCFIPHTKYIASLSILEEGFVTFTS